jgi:hypothetical protein
MAYDWRTDWPNVFARHADACPVRSGHRCTCGPLGYRASARDPGTGRRVLSPDFETVAEARAWLGEQQETLEAARGVARDEAELGAVIDDFTAAAENGLARDRGGVVYSPERIRELRESLGYVDAQLGTMNIQDVRRRHVQGLVDQLRLAGTDVERLTAVVDALRSLYIYAIQREVVDFSPVVQLTLPDDRGPMPSYEQPTPVHPPDAAEPTRVAATTVPTTPPPSAMTPAPLPAPEAVTAMIAPGLTQPAPAIAATNGAATNGTAMNGTATNGAATTASVPAPAPSQSSGPAALAEQYYQALTPERVLWWTLLIIVVVSVLIAIVLAAESV